jgi:hypothetical protein
MWSPRWRYVIRAKMGAFDLIRHFSHFMCDAMFLGIDADCEMQTLESVYSR